MGSEHDKQDARQVRKDSGHSPQNPHIPDTNKPVRENAPDPRDQPCPKCKRDLDFIGRCFHCYEWMCKCGQLTGSCLISMCMRCQMAEDRGDGQG